jgi:hypothetical protein
MDESFTDPSRWALLRSIAGRSSIRIRIEGPGDLLKLRRAVPHFAEISSVALKRLVDSEYESTASSRYIQQIHTAAQGEGLQSWVTTCEDVVSLVPYHLEDGAVCLIEDPEEAADIQRRMQQAGCRIISTTDLDHEHHQE